MEPEAPVWQAEVPADPLPAPKAGHSAWPPARDGDDSADAGEAEPTAESHPWRKAWPEEEANDPDADLRNALRAHFQDRPPSSPAPDPIPPELPDIPDEAVHRSIVERFAASWRRPAPLAPEAGDPLTEPAEEAAETAETGGSERPFDERLYREIEETQEHARLRRDNRGGLALAAGWGLFLCVASGLTFGLFAFRDIAAGALPGLAALYSALGTPVTTQPLIFESVQYEWNVEDYKPVLVIKGAVYNRGPAQGEGS